MPAHIDFNDQTPHGRLLRRFLNGLESGLDDGNDNIAVMQQMLNGVGDGTQIGHFDYLVTHYGFGGWKVGDAITDTHRTAAKACWDEINSLLGKLNSDNSVSEVNAAIKQIIAKLR